MNAESTALEIDINLSSEKLELMRRTWHKDCFACGEKGFLLKHKVSPDNFLESVFFCGNSFSGYKDKLHGGVIMTLMDSAMTNCLFAAGIAAVTGEIKVRFLKAVVPCENILVRAWITNHKSPLYVLKSELYQQGLLKCRATARFMKIN